MNRKIITITLLLFSVLSSFGQNWADFEQKGFDLMYFMYNGNRVEVPEETWSLSNFRVNGEADIFMSGQQGGGFNYAKAVASGNQLTILFENNSRNIITISRYDRVNSILYTSDSYGCERVFKVHKREEWNDFMDRKLRLKYWRRDNVSGTVNGETLVIKPFKGEGMFNTVFIWSGMENGGRQRGVGIVIGQVISLKNIDGNKNVTGMTIVGYHRSKNILYCYDFENRILRAFIL